MTSTPPLTGPFKVDNISSVPKANRDRLISSFVEEQKSYAKIHAYQGKAEISSWRSEHDVHRPPPSTIVGFGTPVLKARRSRKENRSGPASSSPVRPEREPLQQVVKARDKTKVAQVSTPASPPPKRKRKAPSPPESSCEEDEEAARLKQRRERKRARRKITQKPVEEVELNNSAEEDGGNKSKKGKNKAKKAKVPVGYALMHGFKADNVGKNRLTMAPQLGVFNKGKASLKADVKDVRRKKKRSHAQSFEEKLLNQVKVSQADQETCANARKDKGPKRKTSAQSEQSLSDSDEDQENSALAPSADWNVPSSEFRLAAARQSIENIRAQSEPPLSSPTTQPPASIIPPPLSVPKSAVMQTDQFGWDRDDISSIGPWQSASQCAAESQKQCVDSKCLKTSKYFTAPDSELMTAHPSKAHSSRLSAHPSKKYVARVTACSEHSLAEPLLPGYPSLADLASTNRIQDDSNTDSHFGNSLIASASSEHTAQPGLNLGASEEPSALSNYDTDLPPNSRSELGSLLSLYQQFGLAANDVEEPVDEYHPSTDFIYENVGPNRFSPHQDVFDQTCNVQEYSEYPMLDFEPTEIQYIPDFDFASDPQDAFLQDGGVIYDDYQDIEMDAVFEYDDTFVSWQNQYVEETYEEEQEEQISPVRTPWLDHEESGDRLSSLTRAEQEVASALKNHWLPQKL